MTDLKKHYALTILHDVSTASYFTNPKLYAIFILKRVELCVQFGNGVGAASTYSSYGLLLCAVLERYELGYRFGQLALQLADRPSDKPYAAKTILIHNCTIAHWKEALRERIPSFQKGYQLALETGDHEFAAASAFQLINFAFWCGENLDKIEETVELYQPAIEQFQQPGISFSYDQLRWVVLRLLGKAQKLSQFLSDDDRDAFRSADGARLANFELLMLMYACILSRWEEAIERANNLDRYRDAIVGTFMVPIAAFYSSLALLSNCAELAPLQKQQRLKQVATYQKKMKQWAARAPMNYGHKFHLVEAERHRVLGNRSEAIDQ